MRGGKDVLKIDCQSVYRMDGEELDRLGVYLEYYKKARKEGNGTDGSDDEGEG